VHNRYRDITDLEKNRITLEFSERYFDKTKFSDITINEVHINHNNQIEFFGKSNNLSQNPQQLIILLKNSEGDLLDRIKVNINQMREGLNEYDDTIMNLKKY
jgi:predicted transcriptional regulator